MKPGNIQAGGFFENAANNDNRRTAGNRSSILNVFQYICYFIQYVEIFSSDNRQAAAMGRPMA
jgi:hypothetical protein